MLLATAGFINATGGVNGDNPTEFVRDDVDLVIETLADANAYTVSDQIEGADKFGSAPVNIKSGRKTEGNYWESLKAA